MDPYDTPNSEAENLFLHYRWDARRVAGEGACIRSDHNTVQDGLSLEMAKALASAHNHALGRSLAILLDSARWPYEVPAPNAKLRVWTWEQLRTQWEAGDLRADVPVFIDGFTLIEASAAQIEARTEWIQGNNNAFEPGKALRFTTLGQLAQHLKLTAAPDSLAGRFRRVLDSK
jgi:hypothetical protein